jgi:LmbE family N-acetylglucosaminyl deacetylase
VAKVSLRSSKAKRRIWFYTGLLLGIFALYFYQPQRYDFFPNPVPKDNPAVDPDAKTLFSKGAKVMIVTAHPDDTEFYLGGLLTKLAHSGAVVDEVVCTDGDKSYYLVVDTRAMRSTRRAEQLKAANASNVHHVQFLAYPDGRLFPTTDVVKAIRDQILSSKPDYLLCFDPEYPPRAHHRDHLYSGAAAAEAVKGTSVKWLMMFATRAANYTVDVSDEWDRQSELLAIHASQFHGERLEQIRNMVAYNAYNDGDRIGVAYGEGFRCVKLR